MNRSVNDRQLEVLRWIATGCPDRAWPDESHKHSARALQNRGLARVSRRGGKWAASLTDTGRHYLKHGEYPEEPVELLDPVRRARAARGQPVSTHDPSHRIDLAEPLGPPPPTDAQRLYLQMLSAGCRLEIADGEFGKAARELQQSRLAPRGKVLKSRRRGWHHQVLYFVDDPQTVVPVRAVTVPARLTNSHLLARRYRDTRDHHEVSTQHLPRAVRVMHALATVFDELNYELTMDTSRAPDGQFRIRRGTWGTSIRLLEKSAPGGAVLPHYNRRQYEALPAWQARRQKQFLATGKLTIQVGGAYALGHGRQLRFSDGRRHTLEEVLPGVVREVEMRFLEHEQDEEEAQRETHGQQERWQRVLADAEVRAAEVFRAEVLQRRARTWRDWQDQTAYVDGLAGHLEQLPGEERIAAATWIKWSRTQLAATDPMQGNQAMPTVPDPTREFVEPHVRGWAGPYGAFRG